jgi:hypothetical protein
MTQPHGIAGDLGSDDDSEDPAPVSSHKSRAIPFALPAQVVVTMPGHLLEYETHSDIHADPKLLNRYRCAVLPFSQGDHGSPA